MIDVKIKDRETIKTAAGRTIEEILDLHIGRGNYTPYIAIHNDTFASFQKTLTENSQINFYNRYYVASRRAYENAAVLMLAHVVHTRFAHLTLSIQHSMCDGIYFEFPGSNVDSDIVRVLSEAFQRIVEADKKIVPELISKQSAVCYFQHIKNLSTAALLEDFSGDTVELYHLDGIKYWLPSPPLSRTGLLRVFRFIRYGKGFVLRLPLEGEPLHLSKMTKQIRLYEIFEETIRWAEILGITQVSQINQLVKNQNISDLIKISEALHEKKISRIADRIASSKRDRRLVFISGPSSSGKTTFMKKLYIQLRVLGYKVVTLSLDNYFKDRSELRKEQGADLNFEVLEALDLALLNDQLNRLLVGKPVLTPVYDFTTGEKGQSKSEIIADKDTVVILEGIHGINPGLTRGIDDSYKYKIYISALTHLNLDDINRITTHDMRLIRRIVRDGKYRAYDAARTIEIWKKVIEGEKKYIFTFQGEADVMFNSSLSYELGVLKRHAEALLRQVPETNPSHPESERLLDFLAYFEGIGEEEIPPTSIIREFIGNSSFKYA